MEVKGYGWLIFKLLVFTAVRGLFITLSMYVLHQQVPAVPALTFWCSWVLSITWYYLIPSDGGHFKGVRK